MDNIVLLRSKLKEMKRGDLIEVTITDFAFGGKGIARQATENGNYIIFVDNTIPGQTVQARIAKKRKKFAECKLIKVLERSPDEKLLDYQPISGAPFISLPIDLQHKYKQESTLKQYKKIGEIEQLEDVFDEYIESPEVFNYRNKMEYSFSTIRQDLETGEELDDQFALGFKTRGTWWKVENLDGADGLFDAAFEEKLKEIRTFLEKTGLPAWHPPQKVGFFRHLVVRKSFDVNQLLINLVTSSQGLENFDREAFVAFMVDLLGARLAGLQHTVNDDVADRAKIENGANGLLYGKPVVLEKLLGLQFEISMESFFQTNPKSAERLYSKAIAYAQEKFDLKGEFLMDLFCEQAPLGR